MSSGNEISRIRRTVQPVRITTGSRSGTAWEDEVASRIIFMANINLNT
jgi:hypothetical protein